MSNITRGNVRMALASVRSTKWRSLLTMLGVIIGIVSVVMVVGIGEGVKQQVATEINQFGKDLITVRPGNSKNTNGRVVNNADLLFGLNTLSGLTSQDLETVQSTPHVRLAAPLGVVSGTVSDSNKHQMANSLVLATNGDLPGVLNRTIAYGDFFQKDDENNAVAVIGHSVAQTLFGESVPLGQTFTFRGQPFIVRGIFN